MLMVNQLTGFGVGAAVGASGASDPYWASVALLFQPTAADFSGGSYPTDATGKAITYFGNAALSDQAPFSGGASVALDGSGDVLHLADDLAWTFDGDFVVEAICTSGQTGSAAVVSHSVGGAAPNRSWSLWRAWTSSVPHFRASLDGGPDHTDIVAAGTAYTHSSWMYFAAARTGSTVSLYQDGVRTAQSTVSGALYNLAAPLQIGGAFSSGNLLGHISAVRITKGTDRGFTGATIPVPTALWPTS